MSVALELLSPARDAATAMAAIRAGADAVYISGPAFGARHEAMNSLDDLQAVLDYAHRYAVRVHVTLNTLIEDGELSALSDLLAAYADLGVDALIVQDPVVFLKAREHHLELHASTQCNIDSPQKLAFYRSLGAAQAVLPRELSLAGIAGFHEACPEIRLEAFVAGALCVGMSGICHLSEALKNRSANRGECAQICRLPMELYANGKCLERGHLLSMKDNLALDLLPDLIAAGVSSFKIEGRLKDPAYVINLTAAFRERLDAIIASADGALRRGSAGLLRRRFTPDPARTFNRGFTSAMLEGSNHDLIEPRTPKYYGPRVGQIKNFHREGRGLCISFVPADPALTCSNGDGFCFFGPQGLSGFRADVVHARGNQIELTTSAHIKPEPGAVLYRNYDVAFDRALKAPDAVTRIMELKARALMEEGMVRIVYTDELKRCGAASAVAAAGTEITPLHEDFVAEKLGRLGDPGVVVTQTSVQALPLTMKDFNALRREAFANYLRAAARMPRTEKPPFAARMAPYPEDYIDPRLIRNAITAGFYHDLGVSPERTPRAIGTALMTCRHCLYERHGLCPREGGSGLKNGPLTLSIGHRRFLLHPDCRHCRMIIYRSGEQADD